MKTIIFALSIFSLAPISIAQNVNIPDTAFLYALIDEGVDSNGDSLISYAEAEAVTYLLDVGGKNISNMTGIEAFINLDTLCCSYNRLSSLDVSGCNALALLYCGDNQLTSLDFTNNTALGTLLCSNNQLTSLDVSNDSVLSVLDCSINQLTSLDVFNDSVLFMLNCSINQLTNLDVSGCNALKVLWCSDNQLTSLDVSGCIALKALYCHDNQLTSLDVSGCITLTKLLCYDNQLTSLDVSNNIELKDLECSYNQLTNLDVSNNSNIIFLDLSYIPTLFQVCVWRVPFPISVVINGSPNVQFTTACWTNIPGYYKESNTLDIYLNPSDDIINIEIENSNNAILEIYNISGTLIFSKALHSTQEKIDISGFSNGVYLVKVMQDKAVNVGKVVVR